MKSLMSQFRGIKNLKECAKVFLQKHTGNAVSRTVYIVLLKGVDKKRPGYALYVGRTKHKPEVRFKQHKDGHKASKYAKKYGVRLLPTI